MLKQVQPVPKNKDPTLTKSNFKTVEAKNVVGHKHRPLGDWDIYALEDVNNYQIEERNKKIQNKRMQKNLAAFYDKQSAERRQTEVIDKDYYNTIVRKSDGSVEHPSNVRMNFPGDMNMDEIRRMNKKSFNQDMHV